MSEPQAPPRRRRSDSTRRRRSRRRRQRRRHLLRGVLAASAAVAVALAGVWAYQTYGPDRADDTAPDSDTPAAPAGAGDDPQPTLVLATFDETANDGAELVMLLGHEPATGEGTVVLVPSTVVADVPGEGLGQLGDTVREGQAPLLELTLANLLGLDLDGAAAISVQGWAALLARVDGLTLDVEESLAVVDDQGDREVRFQPGVQPLDGPRVAEYLTLEQPGESELQRLPRAQDVLEALLDRIAESPEVLDRIFEDGAPMIDAPDPDAVRHLLASLADARQAGRLEVRTLPVTAIGSGDETSYRIQPDRVERLVEERFAASRPTVGDDAGRRLQVLNGNGQPGIGSQVAELLQPAGFRLVETGNASSFDVPTTRIIVYEDSQEQLAAADQARELLGVGEIEVSEVPVSVVDVTIIVGQDFPS